MADVICILPAITNTLVIPTTDISAYAGNTLTLRCCAGEYKSAKFAVSTTAGITGLTMSVSNLTGAGTILASAVNIRVVKCWWVPPYSEVYGSGLRSHDGALRPDILLHDDALVVVSDTENTLQMSDNSYRNIGYQAHASNTAAPNNDPQSIASFPVKDDSATLQSVNIAAGTNKQFWITLHVPDGATAGSYSGTITLSGGRGSITINLTVLSVALSVSGLMHGVYYKGYIFDGNPTIGRRKSVTQLAAEMADIVAHGCTDISFIQDWDGGGGYLDDFIETCISAGIITDHVYWNQRNLSDDGTLPTGSQITAMRSYLAGYGITSMYQYGLDEREGTDLTNQRSAWNAIRAAGAEIFVSGKCSTQSSPGNFAGMGDIQHMMVQNADFNDHFSVAQGITEAANWHSLGHKIVSYNKQMTGLALPVNYRRDHGLLLWQMNFNGTLEYAYNFPYGTSWNPFDDPSNEYVDLLFTRPTSSGIVGSIGWEGYREGVNDCRYLATLQNVIAIAKGQGTDTSSGDAFLTALKTVDLTTQDLDTIRETMIDYIIQYSSSIPSEYHGKILCAGG